MKTPIENKAQENSLNGGPQNAIKAVQKVYNVPSTPIGGALKLW